ncbi:hypothetical protein [Streptomyces goshikiensis]
MSDREAPDGSFFGALGFRVPANGNENESGHCVGPYRQNDVMVVLANVR